MATVTKPQPAPVRVQSTPAPTQKAPAQPQKPKPPGPRPPTQTPSGGLPNVRDDAGSVAHSKEWGYPASVPVTPPPPPKPPEVYQKVSKGTTVLDTKLDMYVEELWVVNRHFCSAETERVEAASNVVTIPSGVLVNAYDYAKAMGALTRIFAGNNGKIYVKITSNGKTSTYYQNQKYHDTLLNFRFGWKSLLTETDRKAGVGIAILSGKLYKDFTTPIKTAVYNAVPTFKAFGHWYNHLWFMGKVTHSAPWDIKRREPWEETIARGTYPGSSSTEIAFDGKVVTPEIMGNMTYGYLGSACGFSEFELLKGGDFAAGGVGGVFTGADSKEDKEAIKAGISWYKNG